MMSDPCVCSVIIETQTQEEKALLRAAYSPFLAWIDPSFKLIKLIKQPHDYKTPNKWIRHRFDQISCSSDVMTSPALSIMLFLHDTGPLSSKRFQQHFASVPWKLHHRVELVNIHSPALALADQKYYQAGCDTPLWAVCPVEQGNEHLRFNIFTRNFPAMVEFYRLITGVEMETTKDNFCWFQLYSQPGVKIRLGLKHHKSINPVPLQRCGLRFKVNNINSIRDVIGINVRLTSPDCFVVVDPDGNTVYLDSGQTHLSIVTTLQPYSPLLLTKNVWKGLSGENCKNKFNKKTSFSSDSGRFSDSDMGGAGEDKCFRQNVKSNKTIFAAISDLTIDVGEKRNSLPFSVHNFNFQNQTLGQPDLKFEEKPPRPLQKSKTPITVNIIETSNSQLQRRGQVTGGKICEWSKVKSDKNKSIPHQGHVLGSQETCAVFNIGTLENASYSRESRESRNSVSHCFKMPKLFQFFSLALPWKSAEESMDDGFFDQTLSHSDESYFCDPLMRGNDKNSTFSDFNHIRQNHFAERNSTKNICVGGKIETTGDEIFV